ncbi:oocyte zinc finger protein XlCOF7.1-like, partial [Xenopus tropicalis]|uniref:Oocyte zinc finger protein XlCOF7.1-like n=2 Tax=Xenopus tropicalis TaxID=8364 RepID=A0A8J1ITL2_XENTR
ILNLTLEIIYLLTGEGYVIPKKKSPTVGLGALHAPGSVIQKENDKKILELISNIIQLLTGEVAIRCEDVSIYFSLEEWEYIKGNQTLYREGIKEEEPQQLRPLDGEYEDMREIPADLGGTLCYNNEPSKIGAEGADFFADGNLTNPEMSPAEQPPPANGIKEEAASWEGGNQSDCSINPLTEQIQGTDTATPIMGCSLNNGSAAKYILDGIKEEAASWEGKNQSDCNLVCSVLKIQGNEYDENAYTPSYESQVPLHRKYDPCHKPFLQNRDVDRRERTQSGEKHFPCCRYLHKCHASKKLFPCSDCGKCFKKPSELTVHQRTHTGEKPFSCSQCEKSFIKRWDLKRHYRTHTGEKPFPCAECGKCFATSSDLRVHRRTHTGEKPFSCSDCGKCFINQSHLNNHQRTHTGEKPFCCSECGKCFTRNSNLKIHFQSHTGGKA